MPPPIHCSVAPALNGSCAVETPSAAQRSQPNNRASNRSCATTATTILPPRTPPSSPIPWHIPVMCNYKCAPQRNVRPPLSVRGIWGTSTSRFATTKRAISPADSIAEVTHSSSPAIKSLSNRDCGAVPSNTPRENALRHGRKRPLSSISTDWASSPRWMSTTHRAILPLIATPSTYTFPQP